ncbi:MAG TPA: DUF2071 domain-containing protein [Candidatus Acidoferrum sp.]
MSVDVVQTAHRPWPLPTGLWIMAQSWHDLLFAHWPVSEAALRPHIPARLAIDTFRGQAWLGVVPFRMSGVRLRGTPALPWLSAFPELNVRTYVVADGKPGVWFFSLDAGNAIAVAIARSWFHLPYFRARMSCEERNGWIEYRSERAHQGAPSGVLYGRYRAIGDSFPAQHGSLEHFLTERYCLYAADRIGRIIVGEIHHATWPLQVAEADLTTNTMAQAAGFLLPAARPLLHFSKRQDVVVWQPQLLAP